MEALSVPPRLRRAALFLFASVPLAAAQAILASRAPWWRLPYREVVQAALIAAACAAVLGHPVARGSRGAFLAAALVAWAWIVASGWLALSVGLPSLGYVALGACAWALVATAWISRELRRSYLDPRVRWYESLPKPIPGVSCLVSQGGRKRELRVARLDLDGAFLFHRDPLEAQRGEAELILRFRDRELRCAGEARARLARGLGGGTGYELMGLSADARKDLGDLVESLRGEGYVA